MSEYPAPSVDEERFRMNMRLLREKRGWSQGEMSRRLIEAGWNIFHQTTVSRIESGERPIKLGEARAVAAILDVPLEKMLTLPEDARIAEELESARTRVQKNYDNIVAHTDILEHELYKLRNLLGSARVQVPASERPSVQDLVDNAEHALKMSAEGAVAKGKEQFRQFIKGDDQAQDILQEFGSFDAYHEALDVTSPDELLDEPPRMNPATGAPDPGNYF
ncbi:helix-turn-helix domain-containing protein [Pseudarthrobacter sp. YS3]|uniref:helix-turn-helix domain-containing protein n=1 Tax=Pseudarthrobacter sp. YS3 TaxID=3453718 RepID=UPI003EEDABCF